MDPETAGGSGVTAYPGGQAALSGAGLGLFRSLDAGFVRWAREERAAEYAFPPLLPASILGELDYLRSFPHLVMFPAALDPAEDNLRTFADGEPVDPTGEVRLARLAPVRDILTPAACYHVYPLFRGRTLEEPLVVTTRATCFRRESTYTLLERQGSFSMREIVCLGSTAEVQAFLDRRREGIGDACRKLGLAVAWKEATDPFFDPSRNPKALLQRVDPVKAELVFEDRLAIASVNLHRSYFGEIFAIERNGAPAHSGCVAFGIERWIHVWLRSFGDDPRAWPGLG